MNTRYTTAIAVAVLTCAAGLAQTARGDDRQLQAPDTATVQFGSPQPQPAGPRATCSFPMK
jgi:hypothetical protein